MLYTGGKEDWTSGANGLSDLVQATSNEGNVVAFLFANPLRAGEPENPANKILWVVKEPPRRVGPRHHRAPARRRFTHGLAERAPGLEPR